MRKVVTFVASIIAIITLSACGNADTKYQDSNFEKAVSTGLQQRWDVTDNAKDSDNPTKEEYIKALDKEYDAVKSFKNEKFKNDDLHEAAIAYINAVKDQRESLDDYDKSSFDDEWNKAYNARTKAILAINKINKIEVDKDHQESLTELTRNGDKVMEEDQKDAAVDSLIKSMKFKKTKDDGFFKTYTTDVKNTTDFKFKQFLVNVQLKDKKDVTVESPVANVDNWEKGSTMRFEFSTDKNFSSYKVVKNYVD